MVTAGTKKQHSSSLRELEKARFRYYKINMQTAKSLSLKRTVDRNRNRKKVREFSVNKFNKKLKTNFGDLVNSILG